MREGYNRDIKKKHYLSTPCDKNETKCRNGADRIQANMRTGKGRKLFPMREKYITCHCPECCSWLMKGEEKPGIKGVRWQNGRRPPLTTVKNFILLLCTFVNKKINKCRYVFVSNRWFNICRGTSGFVPQVQINKKQQLRENVNTYTLSQWNKWTLPWMKIQYRKWGGGRGGQGVEIWAKGGGRGYDTEVLIKEVHFTWLGARLDGVVALPTTRRYISGGGVNCSGLGSHVFQQSPCRGGWWEGGGAACFADETHRYSA